MLRSPSDAGGIAVNDIRTRVAYLQGLAEGLDIDSASSEGRVLSAMIDVLGEMADELSVVTEAQEKLAEYVEDVDFDLGSLEDSLYADEDDDAEVLFVPERSLMQEEEDGVHFAVCPQCGETLGATGGEIENELDVVCPSCGGMYDEQGRIRS